MKKIIVSVFAILSFFITGYSQNITVVLPNGGEHFTQGVAAPHNIIWTKSGVTSVDVFYSLDSGLTWATIATNHTDDYYNWAPPFEVTDKCLIAVQESGGSVSDTSNAVFSIVENHNYYAEWNTSMGNFRAMLHNNIIPVATQNFINLAERNFYDNLIFHRVIAGFMI